MDKPTLDSILESFSDAAGPYSEAVVIGGGYAPLIYRHYLSHEKNLPEPAATFDLDLLIPRKVKVAKVEKENLGTRLQKAGFAIQRRTLGNPPVESYVKTISNLEIEIEFLTDQKSRGQETVVNIEGVSAQTLSFLEMSLEEAVEFFTINGTRLRVVVPAAWIFHKLLAFGRRIDRAKSDKDLYGIWYVGTALKKISDQSFEDLRRLVKQHPSWATAARKSLTEFIAAGTPETWSSLEAQDPEGRLTKTRFTDFAERIFEVL